MNRQKFLAELSRLLGFMSSWDRDAEMNRYIEMLDAAEDEEALIESLGTPTQLAISVAKSYTPTPRPGTQPPEPEPASEPDQAEAPAPEPEPAPESEPAPPPEPPKKRDELQIVTDGEFEYGMELAILMGEPISAAVESALNGEYLPDPDFSLEEILRETRGEADGAPDAAPAEAEDTGTRTGDAVPEAELPAEAITDGQEADQSEQSEEAEPVQTTSDESAADAENAEQPMADTEESQPEADGPEPEQAAPSEDKLGELEPAESETTSDTQAEATSKTEEQGPVFDESTAPLPDAVISTGNDEKSEDKPAAELVFDPDNFAELPPDEPIEPEEPAEPGHPHRALRPVVTAVYVLFSLIIGLPVALLLILVGVPVLLFGGGIIALVVYAASSMITELSMFSDISLVAGTGLVICGVGLLIAWFGLWVSVELGSLWINSVVVRLGRAVCFEKEADGE